MFFASASRGTETALAEELAALGAAGIDEQRGGVAFGTRLEDGYRACLWSRIASRVLLPLTSFDARDAEVLLTTAAALEAGFEKDSAKHAAERVKAATRDPEWGGEVEAWEEWLELAAERPALFPAVEGKPEARYAKRLAKWLGDRTEGPGVARARGWLERWEAR